MNQKTAKIRMIPWKAALISLLLAMFLFPGHVSARRSYTIYVNRKMMDKRLGNADFIGMWTSRGLW